MRREKLIVLFRCMLCFAIFLVPVTAKCQDKIKITRIQGEFRFDGTVDDECWKNALPLSLIMHTPAFGNQPSEKSEVMICYDNAFLYVGARLYDSNPSDMLVSSKKRDEAEVVSEELMLIFDSFNDKENGLGFATTPSGLRNDFTISKDAMGMEGGPGRGPFNQSWNTFWDVKTSRNDQGWFAEIRIPFTSMRFKDNDGEITMGLICVRRIAHKNEINVFPAIPPNWGESSAYRPSKAQEIVFEGLKSKKPFYIAPYIIGGYQLDNMLNSTGTSYELEKSPKFNGGLDVKYGLTNNLTMDLTINTDFAQVEADDEQINLTRFSLFFPEKRTFFQERSSVFAFDFEPGSSLFYSRRIGLHRGEQVPIYGGARITGMAGKWDIGFLDMQTQPINEGTWSELTSENFGILRLRRQVINENSYVGGILTSRIGTNGTYNTAYGADGIFKISENDYLNVKVAQVLDAANRNKVMSLDPTRLYLSWNRFNRKGLSYDLTYSRSGKDFNPEVGFQMRSNYAHYYGGLGYGWIPGEKSSIQNHGVRFGGAVYTDNLDNSTQTIETELMYDLRFKSDFGGVVMFKHMYENVTDTFNFSKDSFVPTGKYTFSQFETHLNSPKTNQFVLGLDFTGGAFYDGTIMSFGFEPSWNIGSSLQLALEYNYNIINFKSRDQKFSEGVAGFKALLMLTTKLSASTFIQYNGAEDAVISNFRLRYNPREGNDFYIVFNEGRNTYRDIENPRLPLYNNRSVLLKYTYTFTL
ncbi:MAG: carbohydrate binding family 9 domain-containing protein [Bacteroidales bacterium]|nr:carbohydrate binding family 9 domain-containing protein [Bacteroidales bacterium]